MRLDGLGKPPLAQAQSDGIDQTKDQSFKIMEVAKAAVVGAATSSDGDDPRDRGRLGQILDILQKAQDRKKKKQGAKTSSSSAVNDVLRAYQKVMGFEEPETRRGQTIDVKI